MTTPAAADKPVTVPWYHWLWVGPLAVFLRLWLSTLRIRCNIPRFDDSNGASIIILWHDRLFVSALIANRFFSRPVTALISTSKDGSWLVAFYRLMGLRAVRGSSNRRGAAALIALTHEIRQGNHAGVTPDGPQGPRREFKLGAIALAKLTRRPFALMGINYTRAWHLKSWDAFALPWPFSQVEVTLETIGVSPGEETDEDAARRISHRLTALSGE
ncbi:MAG: DUF374 domain-containing protein [Opitutales bacterium]|nr:MAG: DUF374 domain-containing protein [Opitutales bacterium]